MSIGRKLVATLATALLVLALMQTVCAQSAATVPGSVTDTNARLAKVEQRAADAKSSAANEWMLTSAALVLMMTGPGLALFYAGLVRKKNVLGTMMQSFAMMAVVTVLGGLFSYSLSFSSGNSFIGGAAQSFPAWRRSGARRGLCGDDSGADFHGVSVDVRHHHPGFDCRSVRGANEIQRDIGIHGFVVGDRL